MELANSRMRNYLVGRFRDQGSLYARWWHDEMSDERKKDMLNSITKNTIPVKPVSPTRTRQLLKTGQPRYAAYVLTDCCLENILSHCDCQNHGYQDRLLHDMRHYLLGEQIESIEHVLCISMVLQGVLPSKDDREPRFLRPPNDSDTIKAHQYLHVKGQLHKEAIDSIKKTGRVPLHLKEQLPFEYCLQRDWFRLSIYCLLFEHFDELDRQVAVVMPLARLRGCEFCNQSCEEDVAIQCQACKINWWCCQGCKNVSIHGRECPIGQPTDMAVLFG